MPYCLDLRSARAKLNRAKVHIYELRRRIEEQFPNGELFVTGQKFKPKESLIVIYIKEVIEAPYDWGLIVGDAANNMRGALDHLAWQLALRHYYPDPIDPGIAKNLYFPIVLDAKDWGANVGGKFDAADADKLKKFQPFNVRLRAQPPLIPVLELFFASKDGINNVDKHRTVELTEAVATDAAFANHMAYRDCEPAFNALGLAQEYIQIEGPPKPGDEVWRIFVKNPGANPYVEFKTSITGHVLIRELFDVLCALDDCASKVGEVITEF